MGAFVRGIALVLLGLSSCTKAASVPPRRAPAAPPPITPVSPPAAINRACDFDEVERIGGDELDNDCSPEPPSPTTEGLWLNAPVRVTVRVPPRDVPHPTAMNLTVCGTWRLSEVSLDRHVGDPSRVTPAIRLVAVERATRQAYVTSWFDELGRTPVPPPGAEVRRAPAADSFRGGYFNVNLAHWMGLPPVAGTYVIYAALGPFRSAPLEVSVVEPDPPLGGAHLTNAREAAAVERDRSVEVVAQLDPAPGAGGPPTTGMVLAVESVQPARAALALTARVRGANAEDLRDLLVLITGPRPVAAMPFRGKAVPEVSGDQRLRIEIRSLDQPFPPGAYHASLSAGARLSPTMSVTLAP